MRSNLIRRHKRQASLMLILLSAAQVTLAQTVPSELLDMSIEDLFQTKVLPRTDTPDHTSRWHVSYNVQKASFEDYFTGSNSTEALALLWTPGENRGAEDYLAVTPKITQEVHALAVGYRYTNDTLLQIQLPWIKQDTDHIAVIPGWPAFTVHSESIGDIQLGVTHRLTHGINDAWSIQLGVSAPTGSIKETANTPAGPNKVLPYTMQMGSGSWDISAGLSYVQEREYIHWGVDGHLLARTADNNRDYRLGNRATFNIWAYSAIWGHVQPGIQLSTQYSGRIRGNDASLAGPDTLGRYPTAVLNPDNYGGEQVDATAFVRFHPPRTDWYIDARYTQPIYQHLNGPQVGLDRSLGISVGIEF